MTGGRRGREGWSGDQLESRARIEVRMANSTPPPRTSGIPCSGLNSERLENGITERKFRVRKWGSVGMLGEGVGDEGEYVHRWEGRTVQG